MASLSLLTFGCTSAPPFISSYSDPPISGTRVSVGRTISFFRWGAPCGIRVETDGLTISRDEASSRIEAFIPPSGLTVRWPSSPSDEIEIHRGSGPPIIWDDDEIEVSEDWYDIGESDGKPLLWQLVYPRVTGELGPHANFVLGSVRMSTDARDLDLHIGSEPRVIEDALLGQTVQFVIEDIELPQVRFTLGDGRDAVYVAGDLWIDGEFQPRGR